MPRLDVLPGQLGKTAVALFGGDVVHAGHHGPALSERVEDRREPIAGDEGLRRLADGGTCLLGLQQAALEIDTDPGVDFADLAVRLGWYDQAHFIDDLRTMHGSTPGDYAATHSS